MAQVKVRTIKKKQLPQAMIDHQWEPGQSGNPTGRRKGKSLYQVIQKMLDDRSVNGAGTQREDVAQAFITQASKGSFIHAKEIIDREDGRVPSRLASADGSNVKLYAVGMPVEGEDAP